ncbi:MAG: selenide, water dikinase SelD [Chlorobi bacterium]|nr:selenide, water dikinase SelD [Chlorobiota bacterium]
MDTERSPIRLTEYSHGAGCGCKLSPRVLDEILHGQTVGRRTFPRLLVGNDTRDDAAVYDIGNGIGLVSTTDFFMPIVDDPYDFGRIASANAISDIYAMGAEPVMAIGILGWPIAKLGPDIAAEVVRGSRDICEESGIPLAGGHSIDAPEPIYGLAVSGTVELAFLKRNCTASAGDSVFLTKPLGIGIITTAQKRSIARREDIARAIRWMTALNKIGPALAHLPGVTAMTDVTGFGLLGHLVEIARASHVKIRMRWRDIPVLPWIDAYIGMDAIPGGTRRNWASYADAVELSFLGPRRYSTHQLPNDDRSLSPEERWKLFKRYLAVLCDPQTSGGLLVCFSTSEGDTLEMSRTLESFGLATLAEPIGTCEERSEGDPYVVVDIDPRDEFSDDLSL